MRLATSKCRGCSTESEHTHHLRFLGRLAYVYRYKAWSFLVPDFRSQPPVGGDWFWEYKKAWGERFHGAQFTSGWVRDEKAYWIWVTDTPGFDRIWFDEHGFQFPAVWITSASKAFYTAGFDNISAIVRIGEKI